MTLRHLATCLLLPLLLLTCSCRRPDLPLAGMHLVQFQQEAARGVLLNEPLIFHFTQELDPASLSASSARIMDAQGHLVPGDFRAEGKRLVFEPRLARQIDLADGGFIPGAALRVELAGFPVPSGLRSRSGELLSASFAAGFRAAEASGSSTLFIDASPDSAQPLYLASQAVGIAEPIQVVCGEALDPRSLARTKFLLRRYLSGTAYEEIRLLSRLSENQNESGATIELRALDDSDPGTPRALEPGEYHLWLDEQPDGLTDLGGHLVRSSWAVSQVPVSIRVELRPEQTGNRSHREDFLSRGLASPAAVPGVDGAAAWSGDGLLRMRLPRGAGDGAAGDVDLAGGVLAQLQAARNDLHGGRMQLAQGKLLDLSALEGTVVLRSQTSMRIAGDIKRRASQIDLARQADESWGQWMQRVGNGRELPEFMGGEQQSLDTWITAKRSSKSDLTVLVAGGDLWIDGDLVVDGPLVLAAGGRLRISGTVEAREVWVVGLGGGPSIHPLARKAALFFTEPEGNPLVLPLRLGALSAPVRPQGKNLHWRTAWLGAHPGAGTVKLRFLGERDLPDGSVEVVGPVGDATLLDRCEAVRIWIELEIEPGQAWDPPMVDFVELHWTEETEL